MTDSNLYYSAVFQDLRGNHIKYFGKTPEKVNIEGFNIKEVYMTVNKKNVIRGLHFQVNPPQPKILTCVSGSAIVNVVCLDKESKKFNNVKRYIFTSKRHDLGTMMIHVPANHALGYRILEDDTKMLYIAGEDFNPEGDVGIDPLDSSLNLDWGPFMNNEEAILSDRDKSLPSFQEYLAGS